MPGVIGGIGHASNMQKLLTSSFESIWGHCEVKSFSFGFLGAHSFGNSSALFVNNEGLYFAVDGEASLYREASLFAQSGNPPLFQIKENIINLSPNVKGNVVVFDPINITIFIATEWTGSFPLYYTEIDENILFSSNLKSLAKSIGAKHDPVGIIQFMRYAYTLVDRTHYNGIKRLMPGQILIYNLKNHCLRIFESSKAWVGYVNETKMDIIIERFWDSLRNAIQRCIITNQKHALMSSAGWDSRLLLACLNEQRKAGLFGYCHGDLNSKELSITRQIYKSIDINCHLEPLDNSLYDLKTLQKGFGRVENVVFPHWLRAGNRLKELGAKSVSAGVYGEVIGGHYGKSMFLSNWEKMIYIILTILSKYKFKKSRKNQNTDMVYDFLRLKRVNKPWYVNGNYWESIKEIKEEFNSDIEKGIKRIENRGVDNAEQLIEAYVTESRGAQYIFPQLLCCRANLDISNIFADQELLVLSSQIPLAFKIHNVFNQSVLRKYAPDLLQYSTSAILSSAKSPILVQEVTRALRKTMENEKGIIKSVSQGWNNFEFLRDGKALQNLSDDFQSDIINKNAIRKYISKVINQELNIPLYNVSNQFLKIYTTDLMLR